MQLLTQKEAALLLSVSVKTITRYRQSGLLPTYLISNSLIRIPQAAVERLIEVSRCQNHHKCKSKKTESGMSASERTDAAKQSRFGREINRSRRCGFRVG